MQMITKTDELFNYICMFFVKFMRYMFGFFQKPKKRNCESQIIINIILPVT